MGHPLRMATLASAILATSVLAQAQSVTTLLLEGDPVPNNGNVTVIDNIDVNNLGHWVAEVRTSSSNTASNKVLLVDGVVLLTKGQAMPGTGGGTLKKFDSITINDAGNVAMNLELEGAPFGTNEAIYWNDKLVIQSGSPANFIGMGVGTTYTGFSEVRINEAGQMLVIARIEDPNVTLNTEMVLVRFDLDANGNLVGETMSEMSGEVFVLGNQSTIGYINSNPHHYAFNDMGSAMYAIILDTGSGGNDDAIAIDRAPVAEEGLAAAAFPGRNWDGFTTPEMSLNNSGDYVLSMSLDGGNADDAVIVKNTTKFAQEGDPVGGTGFLLKSFGTGPVEIGNNGDVLWYALWDDPVTSHDSGLLVNNTVIVAEGVTMAGPNVITKLVGLIDGYHMSSHGNVVIFEGRLDNGNDGVFRVTLGAPPGGQPGTIMCDGSQGGCPCGNTGSVGHGCANSSGTGASLFALGSPSLSTSNIAFQSDQLPANRIAMLVSSGSMGSGAFGDGMLCVGSSWSGLKARISSGAGNVSWTPADLAGGNYAAGQTHQFQVLFRDPSGPCGASYGTSSAYQITFTQ